MRIDNGAVNGLTIASWNVTQRDQTGKILEKSETVTDELGETVTDKYVYAYDNFGRLLTVTKNGTMVGEYAYDELPYGTRTYEMNLQRGINGRTYAYDMEDRLDSISDSTSFTFDADGFLTSKTTAEGTTIYDYSSRGELRSATLPDNTLVEYVHDPIGRRIAKIVNGITVEKYLWNGRTQLLAVYNPDDTLKMRFEYADGRMPVSMTAEDGQRYFLACDQVGSLRIVANQSGTVVKRIEYDTFGNITDDSDPLFEIPFGFAGGLHDRDTGLVRFGFRDYDSDIGRWTAKDPIGFAAGDTDLFGYCSDDPVNWVDPDGLQLQSILMRLIPLATRAASWAGRQAQRTHKALSNVYKTIKKYIKSKCAKKNVFNFREPASRHKLTNVNQKTLAKNLNTVIEPGVDVSADVSAINRGLAQKIGDKFVINGRTYGVHNGTLYPVSGPGFHQLKRPAFKALGVLNKFGNTARANQILNKMGISDDAVSAALKAWRSAQ